MKAPRTVICFIGIYCMISGLLYMALAVVSICSYACAIDFTKNRTAYLLYLLYFRRGSCHSQINWNALGIVNASEQPTMPNQTSAVLRTLIFSIIYLVLNSILIVASFRAIAGIREKSKNKHILFWSYFSILFISFIAIIVLDFIASAIYLIDFFKTFYNADNVMKILEVSNTEEILGYFRQLPSSVRILPSLIIFLMTSKVLLILTLNFCIIYVLFVATWKVCRENHNVVFRIETVERRKKQSPVMSIRSIESNATTAIAVSTKQNKVITAAATTTTQTDTNTMNNKTSDDNSSISSSSTESLPELRLPRVPYEKSTLEYYPSYNSYTLTTANNNKRNARTYI